ncbi:MAG: type I-C CRISPR-associated endonuclease Cas1c [bacterium]
MRKLLNVLYVTQPDAYLAKEGETVQVLVGEEKRLQIPIHNLESIVCFGYTGASPSLMHLCAENGVSLNFITEYGRFLAKVSGSVSGNVLLRRQQYRMADDKSITASLAASFLVGKLTNSRTVIQRALRDNKYSDANILSEFSRAVHELDRQIEHIKQNQNIDSLRGLEGDAARAYFSVFDYFILNQKMEFFFKERSRRPPMDNMNALISFLYALLILDIQSALESVGLDPAVGYLHVERPGRPGLALDMMEEFRSCLADRMALSLVNRNQINGKGFLKKESGGILMDDDTRKIVLMAWQKRKQEEIRHPFLEETISIGLLPYAQALLLARYIRGDLDAYPPFIWR